MDRTCSSSALPTGKNSEDHCAIPMLRDMLFYESILSFMCPTVLCSYRRAVKNQSDLECQDQRCLACQAQPYIYAKGFHNSETYIERPCIQCFTS